MPTLTQIDPIAKTLDNILAGEPVTHGALTMIPILAPLLAEPVWLTLAEAGERVRITEVSEAGSVPNLQVTNTADQPLLLLDGEELVGAKQNRILNMTVLVAAGATVTIPVSCVEQGRWAYQSRHFAAGDAALLWVRASGLAAVEASGMDVAVESLPTIGGNPPVTAFRTLTAFVNARGSAKTEAVEFATHWLGDVNGSAAVALAAGNSPPFV